MCKASVKKQTNNYPQSEPNSLTSYVTVLVHDLSVFGD